VVDRDTGLLVPPNDGDAFASAIQTLADQPEQRTRMGRPLRERAAPVSQYWR
jgi:glycosyltransferase involved in cell wall biosynthesis